MGGTEWVDKLKVVDLKKELKDRGLVVTGKKADLAERLKAALDACEPPAEEEAAVPAEEAAAEPDPAADPNPEPEPEPAADPAPEPEPEPEPAAPEPETAPAEPEAAPAEPEAAPAEPEAAPAKPEAAAAEAKAAPAEPEAAPEVPEAAPEAPDAAEEPKESAEKPAEAAEQPAEAAEKPTESGVEEVYGGEEEELIFDDEPMQEAEPEEAAPKAEKPKSEEPEAEEPKQKEASKEGSKHATPARKEDRKHERRSGGDASAARKRAPIVFGNRKSGGEERSKGGDRPAEKERTPSGARRTSSGKLGAGNSGGPSRALKVERLVRPFTEKKLKAWLAGDRGAIEGMWMPRLKTHAYVVFETHEAAAAALAATDGVEWPPENRNRVRVSSVPEAVAVEMIETEGKGYEKKAPEAPAKEAAKPAEAPAEADGAPDGAQAAAAPTDRAKENEGPVVDLRASLKRAPGSGKRAAGEAAGAEPAGKKAAIEDGKGQQRATKKFEGIAVSPLDQLFRFTTALPKLYWLPLTPEQQKARAEAAAKKAATSSEKPEAPPADAAAGDEKPETERERLARSRRETGPPRHGGNSRRRSRSRSRDRRRNDRSPPRHRR